MNSRPTPLLADDLSNNETAVLSCPSDEKKPASSLPVNEWSSVSIPTGTVFDPGKEEDRALFISAHPYMKSLAPPENDLLKIFKTQDAGFGIVANRFIKKDQIICTYYGKRVTVQEEKEELAAYKSKLMGGSTRELTGEEKKKYQDYRKIAITYSYKLKTIYIMGHINGGVASLVNCSWNGYANIEFVEREKKQASASTPQGAKNKRTGKSKNKNPGEEKYENIEVVYKALRDIHPGEEILANYGKDYFGLTGLADVFPIGTRSINVFLQQNQAYYPSTPVVLDDNGRALLKTEATHLLVPHYYPKAKNARTNNPASKQVDEEKKKIPERDHGGKGPEKIAETADQINLLPIIEMKEVRINDKKDFVPLENQQFITSLMYACLEKNQLAIDTLIQKQVCVTFVTKNGCSAWYLATANSFGVEILKKAIKAFYGPWKKSANACKGYLEQHHKNSEKTLRQKHQATVPSPKNITNPGGNKLASKRASKNNTATDRADKVLAITTPHAVMPVTLPSQLSAEPSEKMPSPSITNVKNRKTQQKRKRSSVSSEEETSCTPKKNKVDSSLLLEEDSMALLPSHLDLVQALGRPMTADDKFVLLKSNSLNQLLDLFPFPPHKRKSDGMILIAKILKYRLDSDSDKKRTFINKLQPDGPMQGFPAVAIAIKYCSIEFFNVMFDSLSPLEQLSLLHTHYVQARLRQGKTLFEVAFEMSRLDVLKVIFDTLVDLSTGNQQPDILKIITNLLKYILTNVEGDNQLYLLHLPEQKDVIDKKKIAYLQSIDSLPEKMFISSAVLRQSASPPSLSWVIVQLHDIAPRNSLVSPNHLARPVTGLQRPPAFFSRLVRPTMEKTQKQSFSSSRLAHALMETQKQSFSSSRLAHATMETQKQSFSSSHLAHATMETQKRSFSSSRLAHATRETQKQIFSPSRLAHPTMESQKQVFSSSRLAQPSTVSQK